MPFENDRAADKGGRGQAGWIEGGEEETAMRKRETERERERETGKGAKGRESERARETGGARSIPTANPVVTHRLPYS